MELGLGVGLGVGVASMPGSIMSERLPTTGAREVSCGGITWVGLGVGLGLGLRLGVEL